MFSWPPSFFRVQNPRKPPSRAAVDALEVTHLGTVYPVRLKRNAAARRLILRVRSDTGEAVLTMPQRTALATARSFLDRHGGWIAQRVERLPAPVALVDGAVIPYRGQPTRIVHVQALRGGVVHHAGENTLTVACDVPHVPRRLLAFLKAEAKRELTAAAGRYAAALDVALTGVTIKDTRSRWGSCSAAGALAFSWRLILAPPMVLDYLAAHEVAHRREMNHSTRYWRIVAGYCPHWRAAEEWLKRHGAELHRFGVKEP